jgi:hypothetical protein
MGGLAALALAQGQGYPMAYAPAMWGGFGMGGFGHASTAAQGAMQGMSDVVRAAGAANLMNSAAAINVEEARSKNIDNHLKGTKTYFEMKQYNKDYRNANKAPRPTSEQLFRLAKDATPKGLDPSQLDPVTGQIQWPEVLLSDDFNEYRQSLETLYGEWANASGKINFSQFQEIQKSSKAMQNVLKGKLSDMPPQVFSQANAFLKRLEHAAKLPG